MRLGEIDGEVTAVGFSGVSRGVLVTKGRIARLGELCLERMGVLTTTSEVALLGYKSFNCRKVCF